MEVLELTQLKFGGWGLRKLGFRILGGGGGGGGSGSAQIPVI